MLILSNCLTDVADEGCLKVANSLAKRIKTADPDVTVISYERQSDLTDIFLKLNKLFLSGKLFRQLYHRKEPVLYIPFPAKPLSTAVRVFVLSLACHGKLRVLTTMNVPMSLPAQILNKLSGAAYLVLSDDSASLYRGIVGADRVVRLKSGVDTQRFHPATAQRARELKRRYGFDPNLPVVLHVGHMNRGRNVEHLMKISDGSQKLLITSTQTKEEQDISLREELEHAGITIIDTYIPDIQEIYQMADVYFFPVEEHGHCIDVPLSCLEAAACGKPVVTTRFGEMKAFEGKKGFFFLDSFGEEEINSMIRLALDSGKGFPREAVLDYDWNCAVSRILNWNEIGRINL